MKKILVVFIVTLSILMASCNPLQITYPFTIYTNTAETIAPSQLLTFTFFTATPTSHMASSPTATPMKSETVITKTPRPSPTAYPTFTITPTMVVPTSSLKVDQATPVQKDCRFVVDQNYSYKKLENFIPNNYFKFMKHLHMAEGYVLDYVYYRNEIAGWPVIYARKINVTPFESYKDYMESLGIEIEYEGDYSADHLYDYLEKVLVDGSPESYFEFAFLRQVDNQFDLMGYAGYDDYVILCDESDMDYVHANLSMALGYCDLPENIEASVARIDFAPTVAIGKDSYIVRYVTFSAWKGFEEQVFVLDRENPSKILGSETNTIIDFECQAVIG